MAEQQQAAATVEAMRRTFAELPINEDCVTCRKMRNLCDRALRQTELLLVSRDAEKLRADAGEAVLGLLAEQFRTISTALESANITPTNGV